MLMINTKTHLDRIDAIIKSFKSMRIAPNSILPNSYSEFFQQDNMTALAANVTLIDALLFESPIYATFQGQNKNNYSRTINAFVTVCPNRNHEVLSDPEETVSGEILLGMINNNQLIDMRVSGGGLIKKYVDEQSNINPWIGSFADIGRYDGTPTGIGAITVIELPVSILDYYTEQHILKIVKKYAALGTEPVIKFFDFDGSLYSSTGPPVYLYYQLNVTVWGISSGWGGIGELALYDDLGNLGNVGTVNGQLNVGGETGTIQSDGGTSAPGSLDYDRMMDGINNNGYIQNGGPGTFPTYVRFQFDTVPANPIVGYSIWSANAGYRRPFDFTFEGSQDGVNWDVLDTQVDQSAALPYELIDYTIPV